MNLEQTEKKRFAFRQSDKVLLGVVGALTLATLALFVMSRCGLSLINGAIMLYLPMVIACVLLGWGVFALVRRIPKRTVRIVVASLLALLLTAGAMIAYTYLAYLAFYTVPQRYTTVASPSGDKKLVVLRAFDIDSARTDARRAARLQADPDGEQELVSSDIVVLYRAYPQVLRWFYRSNADVEGEVTLAYDQPGAAPDPSPAGHGTLMVDWQEDEAVAHFYVEAPGVSEGGECWVRG